MDQADPSQQQSRLCSVAGCKSDMKRKKIQNPVAKYMNRYCRPSRVPSRKYNRGDAFEKHRKNLIHELMEAGDRNEI